MHYKHSVQQVFPEGDYSARVVSAKKGYTQKTQDDMITLEWEVRNEFSTITVFSRLIDQPGFCHRQISEFLAATGDTIVEGQEGDLEPEDCVGRKCVVHLVESEWQGRPRNEITRCLPLLPGVVTSEPDELPF